RVHLRLPAQDQLRHDARHVPDGHRRRPAVRRRDRAVPPQRPLRGELMARAPRLLVLGALLLACSTGEDIGDAGGPPVTTRPPSGSSSAGESTGLSTGDEVPTTSATSTSTTDASTTADATTGAPTTGPACEPGESGCPCDAGACAEG